MSTTHDEQRLRFVFDAEWRVLKWDDHAAFVEGLKKFEGTKAVDFFGVHHSGGWFIEVKDFRGHRIENKDRVRNSELAREVACKVRDTIAAMIWACNRESIDTCELRKYLKPLVSRREKLPVVLWLEEDRPDRLKRSALADALKKELGWLNAKIMVVDRAGAARSAIIPGIKVTGLPAPRK
jgi:hypothetical protein